MPHTKYHSLYILRVPGVVCYIHYMKNEEKMLTGTMLMKQWKLLQTSLAFFVTLASVILGIVLLVSSQHAAHAAATVKEISLPTDPTTNVVIDPWGVAFDNQGNVWIAAPECDPNPVCST